MRVVLCSDYFYPKIGGITIHIEGLAKALEKRGHEVFIITKKAKFDDNKLGLNVVRVGTTFSTSSVLDVPRASELAEKIKKLKPDVIHGHHAFSPTSLISVSIGRKLGIKTVLTNHSIQFLYDFDYLWKPASYILYPYRKYINYSDEIIAVSRAAAKFISYFTSKKIRIIGNGINFDEFSLNSKIYDGRSVLFVGRFTYRKGIHILLKAFKNVKNEVRDAHLTLVGGGGFPTLVRTLVKALNLEESVSILENVSKEELIRIYRRSHVFVFPPIYGESFGIVLLEAMASKTPIVATSIGGVKELIRDGETGFLVKKGDTKKLSEKIIELLLDKELSRKIADSAFYEAKKYDWKNIAERIEAVYEQ